jgi:hypothetical protein
MNLDTINPISIVIVDDKKEDREDAVSHFKSLNKDYHIDQCSSPDELENIPKHYSNIISILDIKYQHERNLLSQLLDKLDKYWPNSIRIVLSNYLGDLTIKDCNRIDGSFGKVEFALNPDGLNEIVKNSIRKKQKEGKWPLCISNNKKDIISLTGYIQEIISPDVKVVIEEYINEEVVRKQILLPYQLFSSVGILGQDMRFKYVVYIENNRIISEVLPPDDDINYYNDENSWPIYLKNLEEKQKSKK